MNKIKIKKGFTLVELLIAISIIGILATVVLTSLGGAKGKAKETAILAEARNLYTEGESYYLDGFEYSSVVKQATECPTSEDFSWGVLGSSRGVDIIKSMVKKAGAEFATCAIGPESWAVSVDVYDPGVFAEKITSVAYAQEATGFICFDSSQNIKTSSNTITLDSNGEARQSPISPGIGQESAGFYSCL